MLLFKPFVLVLRVASVAALLIVPTLMAIALHSLDCRAISLTGAGSTLDDYADQLDAALDRIARMAEASEAEQIALGAEASVVSPRERGLTRAWAR